MPHPLGCQILAHLLSAQLAASLRCLNVVLGMYNFGGVVVANIISKVIYLTKMSLDTLSGRFRHFHNLVYSALLK